MQMVIDEMKVVEKIKYPGALFRGKGDLDAEVNKQNKCGKYVLCSSENIYKQEGSEQEDKGESVAEKYK